MWRLTVNNNFRLCDNFSPLPLIYIHSCFNKSITYNPKAKRLIKTESILTLFFP